MANWKYTLQLKDAFVDDAEDLNEEAVVGLSATLAERITKFVSTLSANNELRFELEDIAWEMANCTEIHEIDGVLEQLYDICDAHRVWVK